MAAALLSEKGYDVTVYEKGSEGTLGHDWTDMFDPEALSLRVYPCLRKIFLNIKRI